MNIDKSINRMIGNKKFGGKLDIDGDGILNKKDCQPRNTMRQHPFKQKTKYYKLDDPEYKDRIAMEQHKGKYGEVQNISGRKIGNVVAISGAVVPVVLPLPLTAAAGMSIRKYVDKVKLIKTDEQDKRYKIPRVEFHRR